jgi:hypothetical protein
MMTNKRFDFQEDSPDLTAFGNHKVNQAEEALNSSWENFVPRDTNYWLYYDRNLHQLQIAAERGAQDLVLLVPLLANLFMDLLIFHNIAEYFIKQLLPNAAEWIIMLATCLFPLCYMAIEFKFAQLIHAAKKAQIAYPYDSSLARLILQWQILGFLWALLPSVVFAYVMTLGQEDSQMSNLLIIIMSVLGVLLHLLIVFGGEPVVEAKTRFYANRKEASLSKKRLKAYRLVRGHANRTKGIAAHFARKAREEQKVQDFSGISRNSMAVIKFVDDGYYSLHPNDRPPQYRFGPYRSNGSDDDDKMNGGVLKAG